MRLAAIGEAGDRVGVKLSALYARFRLQTARVPTRYVDAFWTLVVYVLGVLSMYFAQADLDDRVLGTRVYVMGAVLAIPIYFRRRYPLRVFLITVALSLVYTQIEKPYDLDAFQTYPLMVASYCIGSYRRHWPTFVTAGVAIAPLLWLANHYSQGRPSQTNDYPWIGSIIAFAFCVAVGMLIGSRRQSMENLKERARLAELSREEEARRMVDEERLRIARDLHDVVAHSIVTISVQAGMAAHVFDTQPEEARAAIIEIRKLSKDTLQELRTTLGFLRTADNDRESRAPAPGMDQVDPLIGRMRAAGLRIRLITRGTPRPLPQAVDLVAYRILQEALTNVVKHAGPTLVEVTLNYEEDRFEIHVADSGSVGVDPVPGVVSEGTKHGLLGMRERAAAVGGKFSAGPRDRGGFIVTATLPIGEVA